VISLEVDRNGQKRPSEAPERLRVEIYRGGGTQGGNEARQTAAAGSSAWPFTWKNAAKLNRVARAGENRAFYPGDQQQKKSAD